MTILLARETVHYFVQSAIATASDHQLAAFRRRAAGDLRGVTRTAGLRQIRLNSFGRQNPSRLIEQPSPGIAAIAGVRVVD
jgi:hypothetical protein